MDEEILQRHRDEERPVERDEDGRVETGVEPHAGGHAEEHEPQDVREAPPVEPGAVLPRHRAAQEEAQHIGQRFR